MDDKNEFEQQIEEMMEEIQAKMSGELWDDVIIILQKEQRLIDDIDATLVEEIKKINLDSNTILQYLIELAKPETEGQFWRELYKYRFTLEIVDDSVDELRTIATHSRSWLRPYIEGCVMGLGEQVDNLK